MSRQLEKTTATERRRGRTHHAQLNGNMSPSVWGFGVPVTLRCTRRTASELGGTGLRHSFLPCKNDDGRLGRLNQYPGKTWFWIMLWDVYAAVLDCAGSLILSKQTLPAEGRERMLRKVGYCLLSNCFLCWRLLRAPKETPLLSGSSNPFPIKHHTAQFWKEMLGIWQIRGGA